MLPWIDLVILALATWRLSSLIAAEDGPYRILDRLRQWAGVRYDPQGVPFGNNEFAKMIACPYCNSVWIGAALTLAYFLWSAVVWFCLPLALSAVACWLTDH